MHFENFNHFLDYIKQNYSQNIALSKYNGNKFEEITYAELISLAYTGARLLKANGFQKGDRALLVSKHDITWPVYCFAVFLAGGTIVPVDMLLTKDEVSKVINDSSPSLILIDKDSTQHVHHGDLEKYDVIYTNLDQLLSHSDQRHIKLEPVENNDIAFVVYTSGTTGDPKGVMIHFGAILRQVESMKKPFDDVDIERTLSVLPICHMYEFTVGLCGQMLFGVEIVIAQALEREHLLFCLQTKKINQIVGVPLLLKTLKDAFDPNNIMNPGTIFPIEE
jgi:long-chain acyl-CoA synthetase